jgi:hypothetical protein
MAHSRQVVSESSVTTDREQLKLQVEATAGQAVTGAPATVDAVADRRSAGQRLLDQLNAELKRQETAANAGQPARRQPKSLAEAGQVKGLRTTASANEQIKSLSAEVAALRKQGNPSEAVKACDDLLVLRRSRRQGQGGTAEFDSFRAQVTRNINALQAAGAEPPAAAQRAPR